MKILLAKHSGFCFGVKRAISMATRCADEKGRIYSLGPLIHNPREIQRLQTRIVPVDSLVEVDETNSETRPVVVIRTHGVGPQVLAEAAAKKLEVLDATCPFVRKVQLEAQALYQKGVQVIIIGDKNHPEVEGIWNWTDQTAWVVSSMDEVAELPGATKVGVVAQTTQTQATFEAILARLKQKYQMVEIKNTICDATAKRQAAVLALAEQVEQMVVIGGKNSANTKKLVQICCAKGVDTQLVEGADDLDMALFDGIKTVGVCAGASTPDWIIEEVIGKMVEMEKMGEEMKDVVEEAKEPMPAEEATAEAPAEAEVQAKVAEEEPEEESFADFYNREIKDIRRGSRVKGTVVQVRDNELLVDIGGKSEGLLPSNQLMEEEAANIREKFAVGDEIEVIVLKKENKEGYPVLSKKLVDQVLAVSYTHLDVYKRQAVLLPVFFC